MGALSLSSALISWTKVIVVSPSCLGYVNLFPDNYARMVLVLPLNMQPLYNTPEEEDILLDKGVMGVYSPKI